MYLQLALLHRNLKIHIIKGYSFIIYTLCEYSNISLTFRVIACICREAYYCINYEIQFIKQMR